MSETQHRWTVVQLEDQVKHQAIANPRRGGSGRHRLPEFVKSIRQMKKVVANPDLLLGGVEAIQHMDGEEVQQLLEVVHVMQAKLTELGSMLQTRN